MFLQNNANSTNDAVTLQNKFTDHFAISDKPVCAFTPSDPEPNYNEICVFDINYFPSGPFVTAQTTYFIPVITSSPHLLNPQINTNI